MQGAKFSRNKAYLAYVAMTGKLKQRRRLGFFSGIIVLFFDLKSLKWRGQGESNLLPVF